jgi:putative transposase
LKEKFAASERQICRALGLARATFRYRSQKSPQEQLRLRITDIATTRVRYGYRRIHTLLLREGWQINHKRVYRLYKDAGLSIRPHQKRKSQKSPIRLARENIERVNQCWSMDFMIDALHDGRRLKLLTVIDIFTRESLAVKVAGSIKGSDVVSVLKQIAKERGAPQMIRCDNGPEFISKVLDLWAYENKVVIDFSRPGKPTDNAFIESFNGRLRSECLNYHWFSSLEDAQEKLNLWRREYNEIRPHTSLGYMSPSEFADNLRLLANVPKPSSQDFLNPNGLQNGG